MWKYIILILEYRNLIVSKFDNTGINRMEIWDSGVEARIDELAEPLQGGRST